MKTGTTFAFIAVVLVAVVLGFAGSKYLDGGSLSTIDGPGATVVSVPPAGQSTGGQQCLQNPSYAASVVDAFLTGTAVTSTNNWKIGSNPPTSGTFPTASAGLSAQLWPNASGYFCNVKDFGPTACGAQPQVVATCYQNGSASSLSTYLPSTRTVLTAGGGANNATMPANTNLLVEVDYNGPSKKANLPFGGCIGIETPTNATVTQAVYNGQALSSCDVKWTYSVSTAGYNFNAFTLPSGFDADGLGQQKAITFNMQTGVAASGGLVTVSFAPKNTYITNAGTFALGIEKDQNQDTTKTYTGGLVTTFHIR